MVSRAVLFVCAVVVFAAIVASRFVSNQTLVTSQSNEESPIFAEPVSPSSQNFSRELMNRSSGCDFPTLRLNLLSHVLSESPGSWTGGDKRKLKWRELAPKDENRRRRSLSKILSSASTKTDRNHSGDRAWIRLLVIGDSILRSYFQQMPRLVVDALCSAAPRPKMSVQRLFCASSRRDRSGMKMLPDEENTGFMYDDDFGDVHHMNHLPQLRWPRTPHVWSQSPVQILYVRQFLIDGALSSVSWELDQLDGDVGVGGGRGRKRLLFAPTHVVMNKQHPFQLFHPLKSATNALNVAEAVNRTLHLLISKRATLGGEWKGDRVRRLVFFGLQPITQTVYMRPEHNCQRQQQFFEKYLEAELAALFAQSPHLWNDPETRTMIPFRYVTVAPMLQLLLKHIGIEAYRNYTRHTDGSHMIGSVAQSLADYILRETLSDDNGSEERDRAFALAVLGPSRTQACPAKETQEYFSALPVCGVQQRSKLEVDLRERHSLFALNFIGRVGQSQFPTDDRFAPHTCGAFLYEAELIGGSVERLLTTNVPTLPMLFRGQVASCFKTHAPLITSKNSSLWKDLTKRLARYELRCREDLGTLVRYSGIPATERSELLDAMGCTDGRKEEELVTTLKYTSYWRGVLNGGHAASCSMARKAFLQRDQFVSSTLWRLLNASCSTES